MKLATTRGKKNVFMSLAAVAVVMLLSAALVVPSSNAYAVSQNGKGKSGDSGIYALFFTLFGNPSNNGNSQTNSHQDDGQSDDRKGPKDSDKPHPTPECKNPVPAKYNKHCQED